MDRRTFLGAARPPAALATPSLRAGLSRRARSRIVNPFPPGGAVDVVGRPFAAALEPLLKQPVVIETKAGAAGAVGAQFAANAKPDGYTLLAHLPSISRLCGGRHAVRPRAEVHPRRFHPDRAPDRRPDGARRQRSGALQDAEGVRRRRQGEPEQADLLVLRPLRRAASADRADDQGGRHPAAPSADRGRRAGADRGARQQCAGAGVLGCRRECADQGRQAARARLLLAEARRRRCPMCRR